MGTSVWGRRRTGYKYVAPGPSALATETWTGGNNASWPAQWTVAYNSSNGSTGTATIQSNAGQLTSPANAFAYSGTYAFLKGMTATTDMNAVISVTVPTQTEQYFSVGVDSDGASYYDPNYSNSGFFAVVHVASSAASSTIQLDAMVNGSQSNLVNATKVTVKANTKYNIRVQRSGTTIRARIWAASGSEPSTWNVSTTNSNMLSGSLYLSTESAAASSVTTTNWDDLTITAT